MCAHGIHLQSEACRHRLIGLGGVWEVQDRNRQQHFPCCFSLLELIGNDQVCTHPFVVAELACGYLPDRQTLLELDKLSALPTIRTDDVNTCSKLAACFPKASASSMLNSLPRASPRTVRRSGPWTGLSAESWNPSAFAQSPRNILCPRAEKTSANGINTILEFRTSSCSTVISPPLQLQTAKLVARSFGQTDISLRREMIMGYVPSGH